MKRDIIYDHGTQYMMVIENTCGKIHGNHIILFKSHFIHIIGKVGCLPGKAKSMFRGQLEHNRGQRLLTVL